MPRPTLLVEGPDVGLGPVLKLNFVYREDFGEPLGCLLTSNSVNHVGWMADATVRVNIVQLYHTRAGVYLFVGIVEGQCVPRCVTPTGALLLRGTPGLNTGSKTSHFSPHSTLIYRHRLPEYFVSGESAEAIPPNRDG